MAVSSFQPLDAGTTQTAVAVVDNFDL